MVRLAPVEYRLLDVGSQECEPQDVAIVGGGRRCLHRWQPTFGCKHGVGFAQRGDQNPIPLRGADLRRNHKVTTTAMRENDRQKDDDAARSAIKDEFVLFKPGHDVGTLRSFERNLQTAIGEVDGPHSFKRIVCTHMPALDRLGDYPYNMASSLLEI